MPDYVHLDCVQLTTTAQGNNFARQLGAPMRLHKAGPVAQLCAGHRLNDEDGGQRRQAVEAGHLVALLRLVGDLPQGSTLIASVYCDVAECKEKVSVGSAVWR